MKRSNKYLRVLICCVAILILNSCAVGEQLKRNYQEATETYPPVVTINSDIQKTGILLVDAAEKKSSLSGIAVVNLNNPEQVILSGSFKTGGFLSPNSGVSVLSGLHSGKYRLIKVLMRSQKMWETIYMPSTKEFEVEIDAGRAVYMGQIDIEHPMFSTDRIIKINYTKERELDSWKMVNEKFNNSTWKEIINSNMENLR